MDDILKFIQANSTALGLVVAGAIIGLLAQKVLPGLWNLFVRGLKGLAGRISGRGSDDEFERKYLTWLITRHGYLGLLPSNVAVKLQGQRQAVELEQVFVELSLTASGVMGTDAPVAGASRPPRGPTGKGGEGLASRANPETPGSELGRVIGQHRHLVIRGDPGSGKTTLMKYLAVTCARALRNPAREGDRRTLVRERLGWPDRPFPIFVSLGRQSGVTTWDKTHSLVAAMAEESERELEGCPKGFFERRLKRGHCLILLDAFDEIGSREGRNAMGGYIAGLCSAYDHPTHRVVVTTRIVGYEGQLDTQGFAVQTVQPLTTREMHQLARQRYHAIALNESVDEPADRAALLQQDYARRAERLLAEFERNARLRELATNPLLLALIVLVHSVKVELPEERHILYRDCVEILTQHWRQSKKQQYLQPVAPKEELKLEQKIALLQTLALAIQHQRTETGQGQVPLRRSVAQDLLAEQLAQFLAGQLPAEPEARRALCCDKAAEWLDGIRQESGILVEVGLDKTSGDPLVSFSHLTFQEYLAARALTQLPGLPPALTDNLLNQVWQEVVLLYAAMSPPARAGGVVSRLLDASSLSDPRGLLAASRCLSDKVTLDEALQARIRQGIDDLVRRGDGDERMRSCEVLVRLGTAEAVALLVNVVETDASWPVRLVAANGLARLGDPRPLDEMVEVPAGEFLYGEAKEKRVLAQAFRMGKYPVTNAQYGKFVKESGHAPPRDWEDSSYPEGKANHPVVNVTWNDAQAYCQWLSKTTGKPYRLPTEEEWERAARGTDGREYPWGNEFDKAKCNTSESGIGGTSSVGIFVEGVSPCGALDMAGNVWEWTASKYSESSYVLRGGSWFIPQHNARCASRGWNEPGFWINDLGFRVVSPGAISER
ncbi:MAG: SUMF1/EgtB/PvdO family nonheme iron enzyme [Anaerolineae bacterium]